MWIDFLPWLLLPTSNKFPTSLDTLSSCPGLLVFTLRIKLWLIYPPCSCLAAWDSLAGAVCSMCLSYSFRVPYISHPFLGTSELAWNELLVAMVKGQECKPSWLSVYQTSVCVISANISLNKANDMTKLRIKWQGYIFYLFKRRYCKELWQSHTSRSKDWGY